EPCQSHPSLQKANMTMGHAAANPAASGKRWPTREPDACGARSEVRVGAAGKESFLCQVGKWARTTAVAAVALATALGSFARPHQAHSAEADGFDEAWASATDLFTQFCLDCHGQVAPEAHLNLERMVAEPSFETAFRRWETVAM